MEGDCGLVRRATWKVGRGGWLAQVASPAGGLWRHLRTSLRHAKLNLSEELLSVNKVSLPAKVHWTNVRGKVHTLMCIILSSELNLGLRRIILRIFRGRQEDLGPHANKNGIF